MSRINSNKSNLIIRDRIAACRMSDLERQVAINALRDADLIVDGILWVSGKLGQMASVLLKPSFRH